MRPSLLPVGLLLLSALTACRAHTQAPTASPQGPTLEVVHAFNGPMPTGVTVSREGRLFVNFPRWEDSVPATVVELRDGQEVPFPSLEMNQPDHPDHLFSVQSVVVDGRDRLWALDTGSLNMGPIQGQEWPKLVGFDLATGQVARVIRFPPEVVLPHTYLNDVRFDLRRGSDGLAFITDSGAGALIVVDLASGRSWRKLATHPSTKATPDFSAVLDGEPLRLRLPGQPPQVPQVHADGIALSADGSRLFFCPLSSHDLYSVSVDALADERLPEAEVARTVRREPRTFASDGLETDAQGRLYLTDWEHDALVVRSAENRFEPLVTDPRLSWPDTLSVSPDGFLYVIANQLHRQGKFHDGQDKRRRPYHLLRVKVEASPVSLTR